MIVCELYSSSSFLILKPSIISWFSLRYGIDQIVNDIDYLYIIGHDIMSNIFI